MSKYHLVSEVLLTLPPELLNLRPEDEEISWAAWLRVIEQEWSDGTIQLLIHQSGSATPKPWEPAGRTLAIEPDVRTRSIKCLIRSNEPSNISDTVESPYISDKDLQYLRGMAARVQCVPEEQSNDTEAQPGLPVHGMPE